MATAETFRTLQAEGVIDHSGVRYRIYESLAEADTTVAAIFVEGQPLAQAIVGQPVELLLPETVFYVEENQRPDQRYRRNLLLA